MNLRDTTTVGKIPDHAHLSCAALSLHQMELTPHQMRELQGGAWSLLLRLVLTTLTSFEAGYQYGRLRDSLSRSPSPEPDGPEEDKQTSGRRSFHTVAPDNTRVGS